MNIVRDLPTFSGKPNIIGERSSLRLGVFHPVAKFELEISERRRSTFAQKDYHRL